MLQKLTLRSAKYAIVSGLFHVECRTSTTRGYSMNCRSKVSRYSRFRAVFLNDTGNWISNALNFPVAAIASRPCTTSLLFPRGLRCLVSLIQFKQVGRRMGNLLCGDSVLVEHQHHPIRATRIFLCPGVTGAG